MISLISKNPFEISNFQSKVMDKIKQGVGRDIFFDIFKPPLLILSIAFDWRLKITKGFFKMKITLISLVQSFLKKIILLCQIEV